MRHRKAGRALGVAPAHRRAMLRNLVTAVLEHQRITTTLVRAKSLRPALERMISLGKRGDLHARRLAMRFVLTRQGRVALFGTLAERYRNRPGGYCRILRLPPRRGDGASMAQVVLVGSPVDPLAGARETPSEPSATS